MSSKRPIDISIFAIVEILAGTAGSLLLVNNVMNYMAVLKTDAGSTGLAGALALVGIFMYLPSPMILASGLSIFIALPLGKTVNNMTLTFLYFLFMMLIGFHIYTAQFITIFWDLSLFFISTLPIQWFLNHRRMKELEKGSY